MGTEAELRKSLIALVKTARVAELLKAKEESDRRNYAAKHDILRKLIKKSPSEFKIDSEEGGIYGITHIPSGFKIHIPKSAVPEELRGEPEDDVYVQSAVPAASRDLVRKHGLLSSQALLNNPEALEGFLGNRVGTEWDEDEEAFKKRIEEKLKDTFWSDAARGPSVFFGDPDPEKITDVHPMRKLKSEMLRVNLSKLLRDYPETRIAGNELQPYDPEGPEHQGDLRHYDIDLDKVREYASTDPKELWKHYDEPEGARYASNVPHAQIITPSGGIPAEYLDFGEKQAEEEPWRIEKSDIHGKGMFATRDIPAGGRVAHSADFIPGEMGMDDWELSEAARYTNHSPNPNTIVTSDKQKMTMVAAAPIKKGDEIKVSYFQVTGAMSPGTRLTHKRKPMREVDAGELSKWAMDYGR
jgi:hypothetical protein